MDAPQPCLYLLDINYHNDNGDKYIKIGTTWRHKERIKDYITYTPVKPCYRYIIFLHPDDFPTKNSLYKLDSKISDRLIDYKTTSGGTEWYQDKITLDMLLLVLKLIGVRYINITDSTHKDVQPLIIPPKLSLMQMYKNDVKFHSSKIVK